MNEIGLTHGGFYAHFESKDALLAEVLERVMESTSDMFVGVAHKADDPLAAVVDAYVSLAHRDHPENGCALAAIGPEVVRGAPETRKVLADGVRSTVAKLSETAAPGDGGDNHDEAIACSQGC